MYSKIMDFKILKKSNKFQMKRHHYLFHLNKTNFNKFKNIFKTILGITRTPFKYPININERNEEETYEMIKGQNRSINYSINHSENSNIQKQSKNIQNTIENSSIIENEAIEEDLYEDDFRKTEDIEN